MATTPRELTNECRLFVQSVKQLRKGNDWTVEELEGRAQLTRTALNKIESGHRDVSLSEAMRIAAALGTTVEVLADPARTQASSEAHMHVQLLRQLDAELARIRSSIEAWLRHDGMLLSGTIGLLNDNPDPYCDLAGNTARELDELFAGIKQRPVVEKQLRALLATLEEEEAARMPVYESVPEDRADLVKRASSATRAHAGSTPEIKARVIRRERRREAKGSES